MTTAQYTSILNGTSSRRSLKHSQVYSDKIEIFRKIMICFCYFCKEVFLSQVSSMGTQFGPKNGDFQKFLAIFFFFLRTTGFQLKLLILIKSNALTSKWVWTWGQRVGQTRSKSCEKSKETALLIGFFHSFYSKYLLQQKVVAV